MKDSSEKLEISTLSPSAVKADIKLHSGQAFFLNKPYASLLPSIKEGKSKISLEGTLKEVNTALRLLVVDFSDSENSSESCKATLTIFDGLNPNLRVQLTNISKYVKPNSSPIKNKDVQSQINIRLKRQIIFYHRG
ncbi:MAG: hypothetical protein EOO43_26320 [Flavobacterium sp.]|nr:MAG: hypothetical protein EOO43_26320 [Flavobacterium sp.]